MPIEKTIFDDIDESDLQELVEGKVYEDLRIEYKRDFYKMGKNGEQSEARKDISAFMNAHGGHLILGMDEDEGAATELCGLSGSDPDKEKQWLTSIVNSGIEPCILPQIQSIDLENSNHVIIIRIPKSWAPPHRVQTEKGWKFFIRNSSGRHEASMQELRDLFTFSSGIIEKMNDYRTDRNLSISAEEIITTQEGLLTLHIIPFSAFSSPFQVNLEQAYENFRMFTPVGGEPHFSRPRVNYYGIIIEREIPKNGYTQIFRNGIIEATKADLIHAEPSGNIIPAQGFEQQILKALAEYIDGLNQLDVPPPLGILISLQGVQGTHYKVFGGSPIAVTHPAFNRQNYFLPGCILQKYGTRDSYNREIRRAFDVLWNDLGELKARFFNDNGVWDGAR